MLGKRGGIDELGLPDGRDNIDDENEDEDPSGDDEDQAEGKTQSQKKKLAIEDEEAAIERDMKEYFDQLEEEDEKVDHGEIDGSRGSIWREC